MMAALEVPLWSNEMFAKSIPAKCFLLFACGVLSGCGSRQADEREAFPAPGEFQLISVTPVESQDQVNLIPEQAFEEWYAGAERPSSSAILLPLNTSSIERNMSEPASGRVCIQQAWSAVDNIWRPDDLFGIEVKSLLPNSRYRLTLQAKTRENSRAIVEAYGIREGDPLWHIEVKDWIVIEPGDGWREFSGEFDTGDLTTVRLTTRFQGEFDPAKPNVVLWDNWVLKKVGASPTKEIIKTGLILNGGFAAWLPGKRAPEAFFPPDEQLGHSEVFPVQISDRDGDGHSLQQEWLASDAKDDPSTWFGTQVAVEPNRNYIFGMVAHDRGVSFVAAVYGVDDSGNLHKLMDPLVKFEAVKGWQQLRARFNSNDYRAVRIVTRLSESMTSFPCVVNFDAWHLEAAE